MHRIIIGRSLTPLNSWRTLRAVRRRETVRPSDDNSRRKMQNARGDSSGLRVSCRVELGAEPSNEPVLLSKRASAASEKNIASIHPK